MTHNDILNFWFSELGPSDWYKKDESLDAEIKKRFLAIFWQASQGERVFSVDSGFFNINLI